MYLWRNLQEGQLTAVLRWLGHRREEKRAAAALNSAKATKTASLPAGDLPPAR
jgi:hypothetical protein